MESYNLFMNKKLLIFDLDGTLINTVKDLNSGINYALTKNGYPRRSIKHTSKAIGNGIYITILRSLPSEDENAGKKCLIDFRNYYRNHYLDNSKRYSGMLMALRNLKRKGYLLAVATNKLDEIANKMIEELYPDIFDMVLGDKEDLEKKPNPAMINLIIKQLDVNKKEVTYIGDSEVDILSASNAGVKLVLADYGFHREDEFLNFKKAIHIRKPIDLLKLF